MRKLHIGLGMKAGRMTTWMGREWYRQRSAAGAQGAAAGFIN